MRRRAALAAALLAAAPAAAEAPPRCRVAVEVVPARAFVGQQLHYRLRILRRRDVATLEWATPLSFPTFRSEWLPGITGDAGSAEEGETWLAFVERRALFPAHAGRLRIPPAALRCAARDGEEIVPIPALEVEVDALPAEGRPAGFSGLLGPVSVTAGTSPARVRLGESLRLSVVVQGDTNLWNAPSPRGALEVGGALEVFEHPAQLARDAGRTLTLRRYFSFDLVPRREGVLRVPEIRIPYFDPEARRYAVASARVAPLEVRAAAPAAEAAARPERAPAAPRDDGARRLAWPAAAACAALAAALAALTYRRRARRAAPRARDETLRWLDAARNAERRGDADAAAAAACRALRAALAAPPASAAEEIAAGHPEPGPAGDAARLLARLEAARFSGGAARPALAEVEASIERLRC